MFIKRIRLHGFGRLTGTCEFQQNKCNVLCQDNEFGKSTLMDAVLYAFYNFPSTGYKRTDLKPRERYRPWFADGTGGTGGGSFSVELEVVDPDGRDLLLTADFSRQQPFTLRDTTTDQLIPLDGTSFGKRYFRMPIQSFTECFFFRQDEREGSGRDDLIRVIEEAAASNQRQQPSSVRQAISALAEARLHLPEFSADAIQVETLLKRIDEQMAGVRRQLQALEAERDGRAAELQQAAAMDERLESLEQRRAGLEYALLLAELEELQGELSRQTELKALSERRSALITELQPFAVFDAGVRAEAEKLLAEHTALAPRLDADRLQAKQSTAELEKSNTALEGLPRELAGFDPSDVERMREARLVLAERRRHLQEQERRVSELQEHLRSSGVPVEEVEAVVDRLDTCSEADRQCLLDTHGQRAGAESALAELEKSATAARAAVAVAKARRSQISTMAGAAAAGSAGLIVAGLVLILTRYTLAGSALLLLTAIGGGIALVQLGRKRTALVQSELAPATANEISLNSEAQKQRGLLEQLHDDLQDCMSRNGVTDEDLERFHAVAQWVQAALPYREACLARDGAAAEFESAEADAREFLQKAGRDSSGGEQQLESLAAEVIQYQDLTTSCARLQEEQERRTADLEAGEANVAALAGKVRELLQDALPITGCTSEDLREQVAAYAAGVEKGVRLRAAMEQELPGSAPDEQQIVRLQERVDALEQQRSLFAAPADTLPMRSRAALQEEMSSLTREREELRLRRVNLFNDCDRAVETWRREGPALEEELSRMAQARSEVQSFGLSIETAHRELDNIADQVFRQWATGINERVNEVLPMLNPRYREIRCSNQLEISAYSAEAGRRLDHRELQHLSKGARDQLQLALRIAVSEYLSAHVGNLPLVFDEPFAHWDDGRFTEGMRFLADLSSRHQVILLSCHHWRYEQLRQSEPELMARLHFCDLCDEKVLVGP